MRRSLFGIVVAVGFAALCGLSTAAPDDAKSDAQPDLDGVWRGFVVEGKGEQPDRGSVQLELTIKDKRITAQRLDGEGGSLGEGSFRIKPGKVTLMDATELRKTGKRRTFLGILKTEPDLMQWCVAVPGNRRPTTYETIDQHQFFLILKRQK
jgi:hypothetical protein